jgi:hypothetical protein
MQAKNQRLDGDGAERRQSKPTQLRSRFSAVKTVSSWTSEVERAGRDRGHSPGSPSHRPFGLLDKDSATTSLVVRIVTCVLVVLSSWLLVACGSNTNQSSPATATRTAPATATTTTTVAQPPPGGPAPAQLIGRWKRVASTASDAALVTLKSRAFQVVDNLGGATGEIVVNGNEIDFFNVAQCHLVLPQGVGRYRWRLRGVTLHFAPLNNDPCPIRHQHFANQDFNRSGR